MRPGPIVICIVQNLHISVDDAVTRREREIMSERNEK